MDIVKDKINECYKSMFTHEYEYNYDIIFEGNGFTVDFSTSEFTPVVYNGGLGFNVQDAIVSVDGEDYMGNSVGTFSCNLTPEEFAAVVVSQAPDVSVITNTELHEFNQDGSFTLDVEYNDKQGEERNLVLNMTGGDLILDESVNKVVNTVKDFQHKD